MAQVGNWGKTIVFSVSRKKKFSFNNLTKNKEARWSEHQIIGKKAKLEFLGPGVDTIQFDVVLDVNLGIKPMKVLKTIEKAVENGTANYMFIGKNRIGSNKWCIEKVTENYRNILPNGSISRIELTISFKEYR